MEKILENHVDGIEQAKSVLVPQQLLDALIAAARAGIAYDDALDAAGFGDDDIDLVALYQDWIAKSRAAMMLVRSQGL